MISPPHDQHIAIIDRTASSLENCYRYVKKFEVAIQAGGNIGIWPQRMASKFDLVYTFEASPTNFAYLVQNCTAENVYKYQAALGNERGCVGLKTVDRNCGATYIGGKGFIPVLRIDDFALDPDFIMLDIEGYEMDALLGAEETIARNSPVIAYEDKKHGERYGHSSADLDALLRSWGYQRREKVFSDLIWSK